jgi:hypothetical protein
MFISLTQYILYQTYQAYCLPSMSYSFKVKVELKIHETN